MNGYFFDLNKGKLRVTAPDDTVTTFDLTKAGESKLATYVGEHRKGFNSSRVGVSSSLDFPEEYGAPEGFEFSSYLDRALAQVPAEV